MKAVFPAPLGPTSKKVGRLVDAAAFLYKKLCSSIGRTSATRNVMMMVLRFGERAAVSQLSSSYHAIARYQLRAHKKLQSPVEAERLARVVLLINKACRRGQGSASWLRGVLAMT